MIPKFGILLFAAIVCRTYALPSCVCTRNYLPVCGSDDETYANQCVFNCARNSNHHLTVAHEGQCGQPTPICICTYEYKPVCGSDGETYPNKCALGCETAKNSEVQLKHEGPCSQVKVAESATPPTCTCTKNMEPVCGTDGVTYDNPCLLECAVQNKPLEKKSDGACDGSDTVKVADVNVPEACTCTRNLKPVCGTDGVTYSNPCLLECAALNKPVEKKSDGACDGSDTVKVADVNVPEACTCTRNLKPVCGTDGVTYNNLCLLECAALNKPVEKKSDGACDDSDTVKVADVNVPKVCTCTRNLKPVCGTDGVTYNNPCLLECAALKKPVEKKSDGACDGSDTVKVADVNVAEACTCTRNLKPVCGTDGVTYNNPCLLECAALNKPVEKKSDGVCDGSDTVKVADVDVPKACTCTRNLKPVCGTDGVTYNNLCLLECAALNKPVEKKSDGACDGSDTVKVADVKVPEACTCTRNLKPVCGTDGVTYNNPCLLECAALNKPVEKKSDGPCDNSDAVKVAEVTVLPTCTCTRNMEPVCGTDGVTYDNPCLLECAAQNKPLEKKSDGACDDSDTVTETKPTEE